jgi:hypothetical protein
MTEKTVVKIKGINPVPLPAGSVAARPVLPSGHGYGRHSGPAPRASGSALSSGMLVRTAS